MISSAILGSISIQNFQQYAIGQTNKESKAESPDEYKNISLILLPRLIQILRPWYWLIPLNQLPKNSG